MRKAVKDAKAVMQLGHQEHAKPDHLLDFLTCVRTRQRPQCNEDEAFIENAGLMLSMEAWRQKRRVRWDPEKEEIV
jgi:hypothetical protein